MTHDEAFAELDAVAFDLLDAPTRDAVLAHVETCDTCRPELDARRAVVADLAFAAPLATDTATGGRARIRERLLARVEADAARRPSVPAIVFPSPAMAAHAMDSESRHRSRPWGRPHWTALAATILFCVTLGALIVTNNERNDLRDTLRAQMRVRDGAAVRADSLARVVALRDSMIAGLTGRDVVMMTLTSGGANAYARMFWDRARNSWTFIAHNMPALKPGRTYQLWLVTSKSKISAGTFTPRNGEAVVFAQGAPPDPVAAVAVTEEPDGGVAQPTGPTVIAAQAAR
jgi:hypothetical protein